MKILLVHNPKAGSGKYSKEELLSAFRLADRVPAYCSTADEDYPSSLRRSADLIFVAGGDGSVARVICDLPDRSIPVGILPLGTANNIARALGIKGTAIELAEVLQPGRSRRLDIGIAEGPWGRSRFIEAVGLGPLATSIDQGASGPWKGLKALHAGRRKMQELLATADVLDVKVVADGEPFAGAFLAIEVLNIGYTGPALPLSKRADPGDGKLDLFCVPVSRREEMIAWLDAPHKRSPPVKIHKARKVAISGHLPHQRVDDEVFEPAAGKITVALEPEAAKIVMPPKRPEHVARGN
jgi:diacylglycerol kinase (ATP)